jgi:hypothetical protein
VIVYGTSQPVTITIVGYDPVRLTFPDGGTLDLAPGQEFTAQALKTKPQNTVAVKLYEKPLPSDPWAWVRDSMRRGDRAAALRAEGPAEVVDGELDHWIRQADGTYSIIWASDSDTWTGWTLQQITDAYGVSE